MRIRAPGVLGRHLLSGGREGFSATPFLKNCRGKRKVEKDTTITAKTQRERRQMREKATVESMSGAMEKNSGGGGGGSGGEAKGGSDGPAKDDEDAHTVFVRSLPYTLTDAQLADVFSEIGPVRNCFTVKEKGSDQHRGFGFVHFAVTEDAHRAVREKNGALLQGRKIKVQMATRRAPFAARFPRADAQKAEPVVSEEGQPSTSGGPEADSKQRTPSVLAQNEAEEKVSRDLKRKWTKQNTGGKSEPPSKADRKKEYDDSKGSSKQRPARTVVVGGLESAEMLDAVIVEAKKAGSIESLQRTLTEIELQSNALAKDGCKPTAASIVFISVKAARQAVEILHQKKILGGAMVWARQLGGEGSKLKQLRLIVRNLPFQVTENMLRELFSHAGFLWEVTIPRTPEGRSRGFAFIGFTSKVDAEKAIKLANGKEVAKRPITVNWAVGKKEYKAAVTPEMLASDVNNGALDDDEGDSETADDSSDESGLQQTHTSAGKDPLSFSNKEKPGKAAARGSVPDTSEEESDGPLNASDTNADNEEECVEIGRTEEIDMVQKILTKVVTSVPENADENKENVEENPRGPPGKDHLKAAEAVRQPKKKVAKGDLPVENEKKKEEATDKGVEEDVLGKTVFIRNLPADAKVPELRKLFAEFGKIKSFRLVLHPITKRSRGNAFLEFAEREAAEAAVAEATTTKTTDDVGLMLKGRPISVSMAVDKNSARKIAKETFHKQVDEDKRNLALAKEGQILPNTAAAEGVSKKDMMKRQQLEHEKSTKLRSSNFHVSKTRLLVHNVPKTMTGTQLKQIFVEGVKSRASKQTPVIKQVKILHDENSQRSRGAAFVEFKEHQHAIVALRVLNNNPAPFGAENRPIVEFAIENSLILRKRAAIAERAKRQPNKGQEKRGPAVLDNEKQRGGKYKKQKTMHGKASEDIAENVSARANARSPLVKDGHKKERGTRRNESRKSSQSEPQQVALNDKAPEVIETDSAAQPSAGKKKRQKPTSADRKAKIAKRAAGEIKSQGPQDPGENNLVGADSRKLGKRAKKPKVKSSTKAPCSDQAALQRQPGLAKESKFKANQTRDQQRTPNGRSHPEIETRKNRKRKGEVKDSLDNLVSEYRKKYFSSESTRTGSKGIMASKEHRKWFE